MIHGEADELVPENSVRKLVDKLNTQKGVAVDYRVVPGADHVFAQQADLISEAVESYVSTEIARKHMALAAD
jgi:alpha/beta superfamily hydrolase